MKTIDNNIHSFEFTIKKSRFVSIAKKVTSKKEVEEFLNQYKDSEATHNCYAYRIGIQRQMAAYDDNGEPKGTAGTPILNVIEKNDLTNVIILVIRYFGGIKLGAGPLTRAYSKAASNLIKEIAPIDIVKKQQVIISFPIADIKEVENIISKNNWELIDKQFADDVTFTFLTNEKTKVEFLNKNVQILSTSLIYA